MKTNNYLPFPQQAEPSRYHVLAVVYRNGHGSYKYDLFMHKFYESEFPNTEALQRFRQTMDEETTYLNLKDSDAQYK